LVSSAQEQIFNTYYSEKGFNTNTLTKQFEGVQNLEGLMCIVLSGICVETDDKLPDTDKTYGELM